MGFDIRTLVMVLTLISGVFAVSLFLMGRQRLRHAHMNWWALSLLLESTGFLCITLRNELFPFISIVIANVLIMAGMFSTLFGIEAFFGRPKPRYRDAAMVLISIFSSFVYFTYVQPNVNLRIVIISLALAAVSTICVRELRRQPEPEMRHPAKMGEIGLIAFAGLLVVRSIWTLGEESISDFLVAGTIQAVSLTAFIIFIAIKTFTVLWLTTRRLTLELERYANTDPLTSTLNRRNLFDRLYREVSRAHRSGRPLTVIMVDLDHFKHINDRLGHLAGDAALIKVASILQAHLRSDDLVGRYGGEEFLIVLPETNASEGSQIAERIRLAITAERASSLGEVFTAPISASFGIAMLVSAEDGIESLIAAADQALYKAKDAGRNRIEIAIKASTSAMSAADA